MDLNAFLSRGRLIESVELISFPHTPIQYVQLLADGGQFLCLGMEMHTIAERLEIGVLMTFDRTIDSGQRENLPGGRVESFEALSPPVSDKVSGIRVQLDTGVLTITPDAFPYGVYVEFGDVKRGEPEYSLDQYRVLPPTTPVA